MFGLIGFISCGFEEIVAFFWVEKTADVVDRLPELFICSSGDLADERLAL